MDAEALYQEKILTLARQARASSRLDQPTLTAVLSNPTCGDRVAIDINLDADGRISAVGAKANGCALCEAATGLALQAMPGLSTQDCITLGDQIEAWLKGRMDATSLSGQEAFTPVKAFGSRHGCVSLPFHAAARAVAEGDQ